MSEYYVHSFLPSWARLTGESGELELEPSFQFQFEWEKSLSVMWYELTDSEREKIIPIEPPYTEEGVVAFLELLKETKANRSMFGSIVSILPDVTKDKEFPINALKNRTLLDALKKSLRNGTHPVLFSWMKKIEHTNQCFLIGKYQVTNGCWERVMGNNPSNFKGMSRPVENVSWFDCIEFCNRLSDLEGLEKAYTTIGQEVECNFASEGYRLPTLAEWRFAAKANQDFLYSGSDDIDEVAWYDENSNSKTHPVGEKKCNGFGLYDMSGNVQEWCWDLWAFDSFRTHCGGSWFTSKNYSRISEHFSFHPDYHFNYQGFRLSRTII